MGVESGDGGGSGDGAHEVSTRDVVTGQDGSPGDVLLADTGSTDGSEDVVFMGGKGCGTPGHPCCSNEACYGDGCCVDEVCQANGADCGHGLGTCSNGACGNCGAIGEACCRVDMSADCSGVPDAGTCTGCTQTGSMCTSDTPGHGKCVACGGDGQECCFGDCTDEFAYCAYAPKGGNGACSSACGGSGQPCCNYGLCRNGGCCMTGGQGNDHGTCVESPTCGCTSERCTTCGADGDKCCAGGLCGYDDGMCFDGTCQVMHP